MLSRSGLRARLSDKRGSTPNILWLSVWRQPDGDRDRLRTGNQGLENRDWGENIDFLTIFGTKIAIFGRS